MDLMYSHSRIAMFESCPRRYKFKYIERVRTEAKSIEAYLGSRVHEALEKLYKLVQNGCVPSEHDILAFYEAEWDRNWTENVTIVEPELKPEHYRQVGRQCLQDYYRHYHPFNHGKVVGLERRIVVNLEETGKHQLEGYVDRIDKAGDGVFEIHDYKTNRSLPTQVEKDQDRQLALYEIGLREMISEIRDVVLVWHYLRFDQEIRSRRTEHELEDLRRTVVGRIEQIEMAKRSDDFPPVESNLCNWCEYRPLCPLWKHLYSTESKPEIPADDGAALVNRLAEIAARRQEMNSADDELKAEKKQIEQAIIEYAQRHGLARVFGADREANVKKKLVWQIPTKGDNPEQHEALVAQLRKLPAWENLSELSRKKLESLLAEPGGESVREQLGPLVTQTEEWQVSLRKTKDRDA